MARSIGAIIAGFLVIAVLSVGTGELVKAVIPGAINEAGRMESVPLLLFSQLKVAIYATFGCWLAARLAGRLPMRHALILGLLGLVYNLVSAPAALAMVPMWYMVVAIVLVMPYAWLGGRLAERQMGATGASARVEASRIGA